MSIGRSLCLLVLLMMLVTCLLVRSYASRAVLFREAVIHRFLQSLHSLIYKQKEEFYSLTEISLLDWLVFLRPS